MIDYKRIAKEIAKHIKMDIDKMETLSFNVKYVMKHLMPADFEYMDDPSIKYYFSIETIFWFNSLKNGWCEDDELDIDKLAEELKNEMSEYDEYLECESNDDYFIVTF